MHRVLINSNFTGEELVLFGTVEPDAASVVRRGGYDLVVTVTGPRQTMVTRRKERVFGIWVNAESRDLRASAVLSRHPGDRPLGAVANPERCAASQLGLDNSVLPQRIGVDIADTVQDDPFRARFPAAGKWASLCISRGSTAVTFLTPTLFRAAIPLPAEAPVGDL